MIKGVLRYLGQAVVLAIGAAIVAYFSIQPSYEAFPADRAQIKLSFAHVGKPKGECRRLTREELEALPPNMRRPTKCPRERVPLRIELEVDGVLLYADTIEATGLSKDLPATVYEKLETSPGAHRLVARLRDSARDEGFDYVSETEVTLVPREILVIDFAADRGFMFL